MGTQLAPLTLDLIQEGEFMDDVNSEIADLQTQLVGFRRQYGEKSKKAKAKVVIEIEMAIEDAEDGAYSVKSSIKTTMPKRPSAVSLALESDMQTGQGALFVRTSGSDEYDPRQRKLSTRDGRTIDQDTGEPEA